MTHHSVKESLAVLNMIQARYTIYCVMVIDANLYDATISNGTLEKFNAHLVSNKKTELGIHLRGG